MVRTAVCDECLNSTCKCNRAGVEKEDTHLTKTKLHLQVESAKNYDAQAHMITHQVRGRIFHATIPSAQLASELMVSGAPADIAEATAIFRAVLACQEVRDTQPVPCSLASAFPRRYTYTPASAAGPAPSAAPIAMPSLTPTPLTPMTCALG